MTKDQPLADDTVQNNGEDTWQTAGARHAHHDSRHDRPSHQDHDAGPSGQRANGGMNAAHKASHSNNSPWRQAGHRAQGPRERDSGRAGASHAFERNPDHSTAHDRNNPGRGARGGGGASNGTRGRGQQPLQDRPPDWQASELSNPDGSRAHPAFARHSGNRGPGSAREADGPSRGPRQQNNFRRQGSGPRDHADGEGQQYRGPRRAAPQHPGRTPDKDSSARAGPGGGSRAPKAGQAPLRTADFPSIAPQAEAPHTASPNAASNPARPGEAFVPAPARAGSAWGARLHAQPAPSSSQTSSQTSASVTQRGPAPRAPAAAPPPAGLMVIGHQQQRRSASGASTASSPPQPPPSDAAAGAASGHPAPSTPPHAPATKPADEGVAAAFTSEPRDAQHISAWSAHSPHAVQDATDNGKRASAVAEDTQQSPSPVLEAAAVPATSADAYSSPSQKPESYPPTPSTPSCAASNHCAASTRPPSREDATPPAASTLPRLPRSEADASHHSHASLDSLHHSAAARDSAPAGHSHPQPATAPAPAASAWGAKPGAWGSAAATRTLAQKLREDNAIAASSASPWPPAPASAGRGRAKSSVGDVRVPSSRATAATASTASLQGMSPRSEIAAPEPPSAASETVAPAEGPPPLPAPETKPSSSEPRTSPAPGTLRVPTAAPLPSAAPLNPAPSPPAAPSSPAVRGTMPALSDSDVHTAVFELCQSVAPSVETPVRVNHADSRFTPRGFVNTGNVCFINATVQALLGSGAFCSFLSTLERAMPALHPDEVPTLAGLAGLASKFEVHKSGSDTEEEEVPAVQRDAWGAPPKENRSAWQGAAPAAASRTLGGQPVNPSMLERIVARFNAAHGVSGSGSAFAVAAHQEQQDAQEFLQFIVDQAHEDVRRLRTLAGLVDAEEQRAVVDDDDEWCQVGRRNKGAVTRGAERTATLEDTIVSNLFRGAFKSCVKAPGQQPSATVQPFTVLHLELSPGCDNSVDAAIQKYMAQETLQDFIVGGTATTATKEVKLYQLPQVLVVHLMRFTYNENGSAKLHDIVDFDTILKIHRSMFADGAPVKSAEYSLFATISHEGATPANGHYVADVLQPDGKWLHFNDSVVSSISLRQVLNREVFMLFYARVK